MIDRKIYLQMCRECAMIQTTGVFHTKLNVPDELRVIYDGNEYYPVAYEISFAVDGATRHTAIIHDLHTNSEYHVRLEDITIKAVE